MQPCKYLFKKQVENTLIKVEWQRSRFAHLDPLFFYLPFAVKGSKHMELTLSSFLIVCPAMFLAGVIDAVSVGSGLLTLPI